jgi:hypothetical protein
MKVGSRVLVKGLKNAKYNQFRKKHALVVPQSYEYAREENKSGYVSLLLGPPSTLVFVSQSDGQTAVYLKEELEELEEI